MKSRPLYLVDASIYVFRSYFSIPSSFVARNGEQANAVYGYTGFLLDLLTHKPVYVSVAFDESLVSCYRNEIYPGYKANRELPDANLEYQLEKCQEVTRLLGLHNLCLKDYEADDIIGTLLAMFGTGRDAVIVTRDKDLGQLLRAGDRLWDFAANTFMGQDEVLEKFGVTVQQLPDFLALAGDPVDNIPGAPGIGTRTAAALLNEFGSLETILADPGAVSTSSIRGAAKLGRTLLEHTDQLRVYQKVTAIKQDVPMNAVLDDLLLKPAVQDDLSVFCDEMNFGGRLRDRMRGLATL